MQFLLLISLILAPTYVIRFSFLRLPANLLMLWVFSFWIIFGVWLVVNKRVREFIKFKLSLDKKILIPTCVFLLAGVISLFVGGIDRAKLGQFIVLFVQPISLFFISAYIIKQNPKSRYIILNTLYIILAVAGLYAIIQYFTLHGLPPAWWGNSQEPKRALSFFVHPNFYALWCAPLLAFLIPDLMRKIVVAPFMGPSSLINQATTKTRWLFLSAWLIGSIGLLLSLSRSGWLGLAAAVGVYLIVAADKKIRKIILAGTIIVLAIVVYYPNLRYRILLPFYGEKSASSRIELWGDGLRAIKESPVLGLGLTGFAKQYASINNDPTLDTHNFPHNIFLDLWTETGLIGLISLIGLMGLLIYRGLHKQKGPGYQLSIINYQLSIALFLIALLFQGLVDNPYFKNDLALVFWIVLALSLSSDK